MVILALRGQSTKDDEEAHGASVNCYIRGMEATNKYPALNKTPHLKILAVVKGAVIDFTGFKENSRRPNQNYYQNPRKQLDKPINRPGTTLKFDFRLSGQNFTPSMMRGLDIHLKSVFPNLTLIVRPINGVGCLVQVGL